MEPESFSTVPSLPSKTKKIFMKNLLFFAITIGFLFTSCNRTHFVPIKEVYKARFEIAGICSNYTFTLLHGELDLSLIEKEWINPQTGKTYAYAFGIINPCQLPTNLKQGDEFYFTLLKPEDIRSCMVCEAYYPTPEKKLAIRVLQ